MPDLLDEEIRALRALFWSDRDPEGRVFAPFAEAYRRRGDLDQATELLADGLSRLPDFGPGHVVSGLVKWDLDESDAAEEDFRTALRLDDENVEALRGLGVLASRRGDTEAAAGHFQRLAEIEPTDVDVLERMAALEAPESSPDEFEPVVEGPVRTTEDVVHTAPEVVVTAEEVVEDAGEIGETIEAIDAEIRVSMDEAIEEDALTIDAETDSGVLPEPGEPEDGEPENEEAGGEVGDGPLTRTMADLYARQGLHERALRVYRGLLREAPDDADLAERVAALEALAAIVGQADGGLQNATATGGRGARSEEEVEAVAREWAEGPHDTGELSTPFAWAPAPAPGASSASPGRPIRDYFETLLAWEPAGEAEIEDTDVPETVAEMEPSHAQGVVPVASLAPEGAVPAAAVPVGDIVSIASLAPGDIVPIDSLAPDVVDIATLAPDDGLGSEGFGASAGRQI